MRKLLLASAAMLGATAGIASAQMTSNPAQGQMAMPSFPAAGAQTSNNYVAQPSTYVGNKIGFTPVAVPQPGTVVIKLGGRVEVDMNAAWTTANTAQAGTGVAPGSAKINPIAFGSYMRLYPAVDGMATNGLRYGASIELRENFPGSSAQQTPLLTGAAPSPSAYTSGETVFVRRAFAYIAADNIGLVRMGQTDGVIGLFDPCIFSGQCFDGGTGGFNGGNMQGQYPGADQIAGASFPFLSQGGAEYGNTKIVYLSPQFMGFDIGVQYAPSMGNGYTACGVTALGGAAPQQANATCNGVTTGIDPSRWLNQVGVGVRYQGVFGPMSVGAYAFYEAAGKEDFFGPATSFGRGAAGTKYDNLSFVSAAAYAKFDTGMGVLTAAFDYIGGAMNEQLAMRPTGGAPESAFLPSLMYQNGPITAEVEIESTSSQGLQTLTGVSQRHEFGFAAGGTYNVAPGLYLVAEYMYQYRHQGGFDFNTGALGAGATGVAGTAGWKAGLTRDAHGQGLMFATVVVW